ncbi:hypothetical protein [Streptomyces sp. LS1784]|nr:hypothetical protein [Streptomyces sp. LS1784]
MADRDLPAVERRRPAFTGHPHHPVVGTHGPTLATRLTPPATTG